MNPGVTRGGWSRYFALHWLRGLVVGVAAGVVGSYFGATLWALISESRHFNMLGWQATLPFTLIGACVAIPAYQYIARRNAVWRRRWRLIVVLCAAVTGYVVLLPIVSLTRSYGGGLLGSYFAIITTVVWLVLDAFVPTPRPATQERHSLG